MTIDHEQALARRREGWRQTRVDRLTGVDDAPAFIDAVGLATLFPASPEVPNLFHAFVGDPDTATDSGHATPSGQVYGWRWVLGRREAAFYGAIVRNRPTWVAWPLLPAILHLRAETRSPQEMRADGMISADAVRIADALDAADAPLTTAELRRAAGFPTGKEQRAAYLRAVAELDARLLLAKTFAAEPDDLEMRHALTRRRYLEALRASAGLSREAALDQLLAAYLPAAAFARPTPLARHLGVGEPELRAGLGRLVDAGRAVVATLPGQRGDAFAAVP